MYARPCENQERVGKQPAGTSREMREHQSWRKPICDTGHDACTVHSVLVISGLGLRTRTASETGTRELPTERDTESVHDDLVEVRSVV